jgi:hypothetical protein
MGRGARRGRIGPTLAAFGGVVVLVCAIFAFLLNAVHDMQDDARRASRSERAVVLTSRLNRLVIDLETGIRGRLLTGEDAYLDPYRAARRRSGTSRRTCSPSSATTGSAPASPACAPTSSATATTTRAVRPPGRPISGRPKPRCWRPTASA